MSHQPVPEISQMSKVRLRMALILTDIQMHAEQARTIIQRVMSTRMHIMTRMEERCTLLFIAS